MPAGERHDLLVEAEIDHLGRRIGRKVQDQRGGRRPEDNTEAVAYGLRTTAGIITGAAIIMVTVFTAFASGRLGPFQQMGFGLAVAVFLDATIVRTILVPASMRLLGDWNWYLPSWLEWLPRFDEDTEAPEAPPTPVSA